LIFAGGPRSVSLAASCGSSAVIAQDGLSRLASSIRPFPAGFRLVDALVELCFDRLDLSGLWTELQGTAPLACAPSATRPVFANTHRRDDR